MWLVPVSGSVCERVAAKPTGLASTETSVFLVGSKYAVTGA